MAETVVIHTDGGADPNPGPGGWAAVLRAGGRVREISGGEPATTNNRMEMLAAIQALRELEGPSDVELYTDSRYLHDGITSWLAGWKARGWRTAGKQPVKNVDLWRELDALASGHTIRWRWLKGHAGHADNERADQLVAGEIRRIYDSHSRAELVRLREAATAEPRLL